MNELALFAGAGGGILGGVLNEWRTVCAVEINDYCRRVLMQRQDDGILEPFPIWDDVTTFDGRPWAGCVDIVTGGFPCQDISLAGKGAGIDGERSGLWREMARIISEVRPRFVFVENSPALTIRGGARVIADLTALGFHCKWGVVGAHHAGAPHKRDRIWILAHADSDQLRPEQVTGGECETSAEFGNDGEKQSLANADSVRELQPEGSEQDERRWVSNQSFRCAKCGYVFEYGRLTRFGCPQCGAEQPKIYDVANADSAQREGVQRTGRVHEKSADVSSAGEWWRQDPAENPESGMGRVANGTPNRVERLKAIGNAQVPAVVNLAWKVLR